MFFDGKQFRTEMFAEFSFGRKNTKKRLNTIINGSNEDLTPNFDGDIFCECVTYHIQDQGRRDDDIRVHRDLHKVGREPRYNEQELRPIVHRIPRGRAPFHHWRRHGSRHGSQLMGAFGTS